MLSRRATAFKESSILLRGLRAYYAAYFEETLEALSAFDRLWPMEELQNITKLIHIYLFFHQLIVCGVTSFEATY